MLSYFFFSSSLSKFCSGIDYFFNNFFICVCRFCYICSELVIFCIKLNKHSAMGISVIANSNFLYGQYILRALLLFLKLTHSHMKQPQCKRGYFLFVHLFALFDLFLVCLFFPLVLFYYAIMRLFVFLVVRF